MHPDPSTSCREASRPRSKLYNPACCQWLRSPQNRGWAWNLESTSSTLKMLLNSTGWKEVPMLNKETNKQQQRPRSPTRHTTAAAIFCSYPERAEGRILRIPWLGLPRRVPSLQSPVDLKTFVGDEHSLSQAFSAEGTPQGLHLWL